MQKRTGLTLITTASSVLLPYGVVTANTVGMTTHQYWLFPLWAYLPSFGDWEFGLIIPPFLPSFPLVPSIFGLIWCVLGLYINYVMHQYYENKRDADSVRFLTQVLLVLQSLTVVFVGFTMRNEYLLYAVPLPVHFLVVLFLLRNGVKEIAKE